jgi:hypothetical protein
MANLIMDSLVVVGIWINTYINVKHHFDRKRDRRGR